MHFLGQTHFGIYCDDCEEIHPEVIEQQYGVDGIHRSWPPHETGAGHPEDKDDTDNEDDGGNSAAEAAQISGYVAAQQTQYVHHEAVRVPTVSNPFMGDELEEAFYAMFHELVALEFTPHGFCLTSQEWEEEHYPIYKTIRVGRHGTKDLHISLGEAVWYNWAQRWAQALVAMTYILEGQDPVFTT